MLRLPFPTHPGSVTSLPGDVRWDHCSLTDSVSRAVQCGLLAGPLNPESRIPETLVLEAPAWFEQYKIGVPLIDADHISLFQEVARFEAQMDAGQSFEALDRALTFLYQYVGAHFAREEHLMRETGYPGYAQHRAVHLHLKKVVFAIRRIFQVEPERVDKERLRRFLYDWLKDHILNMDKALAPYIEGPFEDHLGEAVAPTLPLSDAVMADTQLVDVTVQVPSHKRRVIERCAYVFVHNTPEANDLEEIALSATGLSIEEARELAWSVLKQSGS